MVEPSLPDLSEAEAKGDTAALFDRIRAESGSALVNYVWRHLATIPGGAALWCWDVAMANDTSRAQAAIATVADREAAGLAGPRPSFAFADPVVVRLLEAYNRNNAANLARVSLLLAALARLSHRPHGRRGTVGPATLFGPLLANRTPARDADREDGEKGGLDAPTDRHIRRTQEEPQEEAPPCSPARDSGLPPLPELADLSETDRSAAERLAEAGPAAGCGVSPSLWRHLTVHHGLLPRLAPELSTVLGSTTFAAAHDQVRSTARPDNRPRLPDRSVEFDVAAVRRSLEAFAARIAELTLAGRVVVRWCSS